MVRDVHDKDSHKTPSVLPEKRPSATLAYGGGPDDSKDPVCQ